MGQSNRHGNRKQRCCGSLQHTSFLHSCLLQ
jgi:hypothetical protein